MKSCHFIFIGRHKEKELDIDINTLHDWDEFRSTIQEAILSRRKTILKNVSSGGFIKIIGLYQKDQTGQSSRLKKVNQIKDVNYSEDFWISIEPSEEVKFKPQNRPQAIDFTKIKKTLSQMSFQVLKSQEKELTELSDIFGRIKDSLRELNSLNEDLLLLGNQEISSNMKKKVSASLTKSKVHKRLMRITQTQGQLKKERDALEKAWNNYFNQNSRRKNHTVS